MDLFCTDECESFIRAFVEFSVTLVLATSATEVFGEGALCPVRDTGRVPWLSSPAGVLFPQVSPVRTQPEATGPTAAHRSDLLGGPSGTSSCLLII